MDVQYFANITVGGQQITGIIDTGSFELVVFESHCDGCGRAGAYDGKVSKAHSLGPLTRGLFYGSGDVYAQEAFDRVEIGPFRGVNQSYWEAYEANMPVLNQARFQSIIGVGPPEMPAVEAWKQTQKSVQTVVGSIEKEGLPHSWQTDRVLSDLNFSVEISHEPVMLNSYNISLFSLCLLETPGSPGYFIWNDTSVLEHPSYFTTVRVLGRHTWAVGMTRVELVPRWPNVAPAQLACTEGGCGAIVDSGTSLLMMPSQVVGKLQAALQKMGAVDCKNIEDLPHLVFRLDGTIFSLPPDAYLTEAEEESVPEYMASFARVRRLMPESRDGCRISVMESYSGSDLGPLWILGMPFFRKYYTTFNVGSSRADRSLHIATASSECLPEEPGSSLVRQGRREAFRRHLDLEHLYLPPIVRKATQGGFMEL